MRCLVRSQIISKLYDSCKSKPWTVILPVRFLFLYSILHVPTCYIALVCYVYLFIFFFLEHIWYNLCWGKSLLPQKIHLLFRLPALVNLYFAGKTDTVSHALIQKVSSTDNIVETIGWYIAYWYILFLIHVTLSLKKHTNYEFALRYFL